MPVCESCGNELGEEVKFCGNCGEPVSPPKTPVKETSPPKKSNIGLIIGIPVLILILGVGGLFIYGEMTRPSAPAIQSGGAYNPDLPPEYGEMGVQCIEGEQWHSGSTICDCDRNKWKCTMCPYGVVLVGNEWKCK